MGKTLDLRVEGQCLIAEYSGEFRLTAASATTRTVAEAVTASDLASVLLDIRRSRGEMTIVERRHHAVELMSYWPAHARLALLCRPDQMLEDRYWQRVTRNRGIETLVTDQLSEARAWVGLVPPDAG